MKIHGSKHQTICALIIMVLFIPFLIGCPDDDDNKTTKITVCNLDNHDYDVELRRHHDDSVADEIHIDEWNILSSQCDTFNDVAEGRYYLAIFNEDNHLVDESDDFYIDEGESKQFEINGDGDLRNNFRDHNEAIVSICNSDDDAYRVALKLSSDDRLIADFDLRQPNEFIDHCDDFNDLQEGRYYITITEEGDDQSANRSNDFYLESRENKYFTIDPYGELVSD